MVFGKKDHLVGLDIGSASLKVCEIAGTKKGRVLKKFGISPLPYGTIKEGNIVDHENIVKAIRELFKNSGIKEKNVALSIGGYSVIVKKINVQTMPDDQLLETIYFEAEQYIPFDINDVNIDFQILGESEVNPNQMSVLLVAAKKDIIAEYMDVVQRAGLIPVIIDVDAFALQNTYEINYDIESENVALIDIGASKTSLNIMKGNVSVFNRDVSLGCHQINERIISIKNCSYEESETLKMDEDAGLSMDERQDVISSIVSDWCIEIRRAIDFFYSTYPDDHIGKIVLSGGGANISDFRNLLAEETSAEVEIIDPFKKIDKGQFDSNYLQQIGPQASICTGLAIRRVDDK
ncbi:MAG: type IV pilus assembly protein PilM [Desulfobacterales bacterium]|nr:type IV pilus assembly protein PilM [Desulfobacterales bacterium]